MPMFNIPVELSRTNDLLERIAIALERAVGPAILPVEAINKKKKVVSRVINYGNEGDQWAMNSIKKQIKAMGLHPDEEEEKIQEATAQYKEHQRLVQGSGVQGDPEEDEGEGVRFV